MLPRLSVRIGRTVSALAGQRVVVTGGAGFIGSHLCDALLELGAEVLCVDSLLVTGGEPRNVEHLLERPGFTLDRADVVDWAAAAELGGVACVFHLAASKYAVAPDDPELDLRVNALGTLRLMLAARRGQVPVFVQASTGSVYGGAPADEQRRSATRPASFYGISKLAGESYGRAVLSGTACRYVALRYFSVIGPRQDDSDRGGVVPIFARRCREGRPLPIHGSGDQTRGFTGVRDVVAATIWAAEHDEAEGVYDCCSGVRVSILELAECVRALTAADVPLVHVPRRPGDVDASHATARRLRAAGLTFEEDWRALVREVVAAHRQPEAV
jgi:UDP-glucose 4-epimerase